MADVDLRKWADAKLNAGESKPIAGGNGQPLAQDVELAPGVTLPAGHLPGMRVNKGGSSCANCRFGQDLGRCEEPNFQNWNGGPDLPEPPEEFCSDWWQPIGPEP